MSEAWHRVLQDEDDDDGNGETRSWSSVGSLTVFSAAIGAVIYLIFECLYRYKNHETPVYAGNVIRKEEKRRDGSKVPVAGLPQRGNGCFGWLVGVRGVGAGEDLLRLVGLDAYIVLRFLRLQVELFSFTALMSLAVLVPVYFTGNGTTTNSFYEMTVSNLEDESVRFWASAALPWVVALVAFALMTREFKAFVDQRADFLARGYEGDSIQSKYTIMLEEVPPRLQTPGMLYAYFDFLFPGEVYAASNCLEAKEVDNLMATREKVLANLESTEVYEHNHRDKAPVMTQPPYEQSHRSAAVYHGQESMPAKILRIVTNGCCCGPAKTFKTAHLETMLAALNTSIQSRQSDLFDELHEADKSTRVHTGGAAVREDNQAAQAGHKDEGKQTEGLGAMAKTPATPTFLAQEGAYEPNREFPHLSGTGFVTFRTLATKAAAAQVLLSNKSEMKASGSPSPNQVVWHDVHQPMAAARKHRKIANVIMFVAGLFFAIPVAACAGASLATIETVIPPLEAFRGNVVYETIGTFVPTVASIVLLMLVTIIFRQSAENFEYYKAFMDIQRVVFKRQWIFTLIYVYISVLGGSVIDGLSEILNDPPSIVSILALTIPGTAGYFMGIIVVKTFQGVVGELARLVPALLYWVFTRNGDGDKGPRDIKKRDALPSVDYATLLPNILLTSLIGFIFYVLTPIIIAYVALFFFLAYIVFKHNFLFVYAHKVESGGEFFFDIYNRFVFCMLVGQVTVGGYLLLRLAIGPGILALVLPALTWLYSRGMHKKYENAAVRLSFEKAKLIDVTNNSDDLAHFDKDTYTQPALKNLDSLEPERNDYGETGGNMADAARAAGV